MNAEIEIDWESWEFEKPLPQFVDRVMDAVRGESRRSAPVHRAARSGRWVGMLAAAAVAAGSLTVLAMMERRARYRYAAPAETKATPTERVVPAESAAGVVAVPPIASDGPQPIGPAAGTVLDRKLRDALRARLAPDLEARGFEVDPHTGLTIPAGSSGPSHNLSKEYLQARIRQDFYPLATACYESALAQQPKLRGQIVVDFMIVGDAKVGGIVDQAKINDRSDITDAVFTGCIRESMLSMVFAPPENNGWITVTYPFLFSPDDDESERDN
jgi:hypothetical protein